MTLLHPWVLALLPLSFLVGLLVYRGESHAPARRLIHSLLWSGTAFVLVVALARPVWDPEPVTASTEGQDTVFLVDVSRSMNTPDVGGISRLDAVKKALIDAIPQYQGDRVALVAFAGTTVAKCPLTRDLDFFRQSVQLLDTNAVSQGGTLIGDALRSVQADFAQKGRKLVVWLFTDGGDQDSFPVDAARQYAQGHLSLELWGVGSTVASPVPQRNVRSALDEKLLQDMAAVVPGAVAYGAKQPLWTFAQEYQLHHQVSGTSASTQVVWQEGAWWLLWPAALFLGADAVVRLGWVFVRRKKP